MFKRYSLVLCIGSIALGAAMAAVQPDDQEKSRDDLSRGSIQTGARAGTNGVPSWRDLDRWSFQAGAAFITGSTITELLKGRAEIGRGGDSGGQIYLLQASYKLGKWEPDLFGHRVGLDLEAPLVLGLVDEPGNSPFMQYNGGLTLRWKSFPWNRWLYTNLETGLGLTYSQHVLRTERERHPTRERSHLEFYWPLQISLALPEHRRHQLVLLLHHHSGGGVFHRGGANSLGLGYRYVPGER